MKFRMALTLASLAGALLAVTPASAVPVGASGQSAKADVATTGLVEQVGRRHHRLRRHYAHRHHYRYNRYAYRPRYYAYQPYYTRPYYAPYYSSYYASPYYYGGYGGYGGYYGRHHRRGGISIQFGY